MRNLLRCEEYGWARTTEDGYLPLELDEARREVTVSGRRVELSPREFALLEYFLRHPGIALSRDRLLDHVWPSGIAVTPNAVDAYIHYLRDKLGPAGDRIRTIRGIGYRLEDER